MRGRSAGFRLACLVIVSATACAHAPRPAAMAPAGLPVPAGSALRGAVAVGLVTGGEKTNPLTYSRVSADDVRAAVTLALRSNGMLVADSASAPFRLDVGILEVTAPKDPYITRIHSVMRYALRARDGTTRFDRVVTGVGEATLRDKFYGVERLRIANERAIRANLASALEALRAAEWSASWAAPAVGATR